MENLLETIQKYDSQISVHIEADNPILNADLSRRHYQLRNRLEAKREIYADLKNNIFRFLEKNFILLKQAS
ncbi:hypothetical protein [Maribacter sp. ACAM166]|uniref:hypothetical protein n=1 Tax=Maribacter sp. ACAM166 TaxID=2508996 RepID=UPI0010FD546C|nr:hypothetical protein [Maribacter sp. ACAM166]TLP72845.1 hypothetical protein ES765_18390 [Maribacter sp. ACAM166]